MGQASNQLWPGDEEVMRYQHGSRATLKLCSVGWKEKVAVVMETEEEEAGGEAKLEGKAGEAGKLTMSFVTVMLFLLALSFGLKKPPMEPHAWEVSDCSEAWGWTYSF